MHGDVGLGVGLGVGMCALGRTPHYGLYAGLGSMPGEAKARDSKEDGRPWYLSNLHYEEQPKKAFIARRSNV